MQDLILAIDQGTTGTTALLFDQNLNIKGKASQEFPQHFPKPGWVEHDLKEIWDSVQAVVRQALNQAGLSARQIAAIGITNQRETTCLWRRDATATPMGRAIVWQDRRTAAECAKLKKAGLEKVVNRKTGLLLDPYFSGAKLAWMLKNISGAGQLAKQGKLAFGTIESYLLYKLSGEHQTDVTNASRTLLMDLRKCQWDEDLVKLFKIPKSLLPQIRPSAVEYGRTKGFLNLPDGIPITGLAGDQQAALFGQACFKKGAAKCTYGTGAFAVVNTGSEIVYSKNKLVTTVAWQIGKTPTYAIEGSAFIAGAAVQWLRDGLGMFSKSSDVEALAMSVESSDGVVFVPALSGMGAPHWLASATGLVTGLTRGSTRAHVARAALDGIAFQIAELLSAMSKDYGRKITPLKVDGGASANNLLMQFQADISATEVVRSEILETTALGSGLQAGLAIGFWKDQKEIESKWRAAETFRPKMTGQQRKVLLSGWDRAIAALRILSGN